MRKYSLAYVAVACVLCLLGAISYAVDVVESPLRGEAVVVQTEQEALPSAIGVDNTMRLIGFLAGLAVLGAILYWIFSRDRNVYRDPSVSPHSPEFRENTRADETSYRKTTV